MWNPFSKNKKANNDDPQNMGMLQRLAMKQIERMSPEQREKLMKKALSPENVQKNRGKILETIEQMKKSGQISGAQAEAAKRQLGL